MPPPVSPKSVGKDGRSQNGGFASAAGADLTFPGRTRHRLQQQLVRMERGAEGPGPWIHGVGEDLEEAAPDQLQTALALRQHPSLGRLGRMAPLNQQRNEDGLKREARLPPSLPCRRMGSWDS